MFTRSIEAVLRQYLNYFPVVLLTGPRQSGKTTLLQSIATGYDYINLESPDELALLQSDTRGFLEKERANGLIIDEAQKYPDLFSYIQTISDKSKQKGQFILSGSQNILLSQQISQSLAGRVGILELLPLTHAEYNSNPTMPNLSVWQFLQQGSYPRPYQENIPANIWMDNYIQTYLSKDVRDLLNVRDLNLFSRFLRLCAGRHGQLLNQQQLATDAGISHTTVSQWLSILEASYILFQLQPYHQNFNKRLTKSTKLYFFDSGLVCHLLGIKTPDQLSIHVSRGAIFEGFVISELKKIALNQGSKTPFYFWRDSNGNEVDLLMEANNELHAFEIKSTATYKKELLKSLKKWAKMTKQESALTLVYAGNEAQTLNEIQLQSWSNLEMLKAFHLDL